MESNTFYLFTQTIKTLIIWSLIICNSLSANNDRPKPPYIPFLGKYFFEVFLSKMVRIFSYFWFFCLKDMYQFYFFMKFYIYKSVPNCSVCFHDKLLVYYCVFFISNHGFHCYKKGTFKCGNTKKQRIFSICYRITEHYSEDKFVKTMMTMKTYCEAF